MPIHVAITRKVKPGCERAFEESLRELFKDSLRVKASWGCISYLRPKVRTLASTAFCELSPMKVKETNSTARNGLDSGSSR